MLRQVSGMKREVAVLMASSLIGAVAGINRITVGMSVDSVLTGGPRCPLAPRAPGSPGCSIKRNNKVSSPFPGNVYFDKELTK